MGGTVKRSSSLLTPSHDCLCTNAIVGYVDLSFLERPSLASSLYCSDCRLRGRSFYTLTQSHGVHDAAQQTSEQTAQSMTSLVLRTNEVGQRTADLVGVIIVIHRKVRKSTVTVCVCRNTCTCTCWRDLPRTTVYARTSLSNMSISRFLDVRLLRRLFTAVIVAFADGRFMRLPGGGQRPVSKASVTRRLAAVFMF